MANKKYNNQYCIKHAEFYLPTQDDWAPNFIRNTVRVTVYESLHIRGSKRIRWARICVWGADDLGMEKDFTLQEDDKLRERQIKDILKEAGDLPNPLNRDWLSGHGFSYA